MVKRFLTIFVMCLLLYPVVTMADMPDIDQIYIGQTTGLSSDYDHATGTGYLTWSAGVTGYIYTLGGEYAEFTGVEGACGFNLSSTTGTTAKFNLDGTWSLDCYDDDGGLNTYGTDPVLSLEGTLNSGRFDGQYWEEITSGGSGVDGKAWVTVTDASSNSDWVTAKFPIYGLSLDDVVLGLQAGAILDATFSDYSSEDYTSTNGLTLTLWGDEDIVVPEPTTIALLGLGGLLLRRRKA